MFGLNEITWKEFMQFVCITRLIWYLLLLSFRQIVYRIFGLGNLRIYTSDKTSPEFRMEAIRKPQEIYNMLRERVEQNRREKHVFEVD